MLLDGYRASPLYRVNTIEDAIKFLQSQNVYYILSVPWASPPDTRTPPAYEWCILTKYLGDPQYLPPLYVSPGGTTVYHVGPLDNQTIYKYFSQLKLIPPLKKLQLNIAISNNNSSFGAKFHIPIPVDWRRGLMNVSINSQGHPLKIEIWEGIIQDKNPSDNGETAELVMKLPGDENSSGIVNPSFTWQICNSGYFTFLLKSCEQTNHMFNVTLYITFLSVYDIQSLYIPLGTSTYNFTLSQDKYQILHLKVDKPSILNIKTVSFNKSVSIEIYTGMILKKSTINVNQQNHLLRREPLHGGAIDPVIANMFIDRGEYSIIVNCEEEAPNAQVNVTLEVMLSEL